MIKNVEYSKHIERYREKPNYIHHVAQNSSTLSYKLVSALKKKK